MSDTDKILGYETPIRKSLTDGFTVMGVHREVFLGWGLACAIGFFAVWLRLGWPWYWAAATAGSLWAVVLSSLISLQRLDSQWLEVAIHLLFERDKDTI